MTKLMQRVEEINAELLMALRRLVAANSMSAEAAIKGDAPDLDEQDIAFAEAEEAIKHAEAFLS